uniref:hypothetical protein n=1 Tax=Algoriphagus sp. TaxID=1872435 RepID=UPI0040480998
MGKFRLFLFLLLASTSAWAQEVQVRGYFTQDSAQLGERVAFVLKASYPQSAQLIFPDSVHDFSPFVLLERKTFISFTQEGITQDSALYFLSNFSLEPISYLSLPVVELNRYDSLIHYTNEAFIHLKLNLDSIPEELQFKENNVYQPLEKSFNWLIFGAICGGILLVIALLFFVFAEKIKGLFWKNRERLRWIQFERKWKKLADLLQQNPNQTLADELIGHWKSYMEHLRSQPFQEWTSSEIATELADEEVFKALRSIDMIIYAGIEEDSQNATTYLLAVAKLNYNAALSQLTNERITR